MNHFLRALVPGLLTLALFLVSACNSSPKTTTPAEITITDQLNRNVTLAKKPQRIVSLAPANTEILFALELADRMVGVTDYCSYPPEAKEKASIGGFSTPNLEKIVALSPDLVVVSSLHEKQVIPQLESKGITVLALDPKTVDEVMEAITMVGKATGSESRANALVQNMQKRIKAVTDKTASLTAEQRQKVLYLVWHDPLYAAGAKTFHDELITKAGGINIVTDNDYPAISMEVVIDTDPAVILAGIGMGEGGDAPLKFVEEEARLSEVSARKNSRIYGINSEIVDRAGPRVVDALEEFAKLIHPELFE